jgi:hypothetical protein
MRDRIDFFQAVDIGDKEYDSVITSLFDQFSALYDLVGAFENVKVINKSKKQVVFEVISPKEEERALILNKVASQPNVVIYEQSFFINASKNKNLGIEITFTQK